MSETAQPWHLSWRADPLTRAVADRHYNRQNIGADQFVPPGRCVVLRTAEADAAWITSWPIADYVQHAWRGAWVNSLFRNESGRYLSSSLIRAAVAATLAVWPNPPAFGMVTFVDAAQVRRKRDPGRCYRRAGFRDVGHTKGGLIALQLLPGHFPPAMPAIGTQEALPLTTELDAPTLAPSDKGGTLCAHSSSRPSSHYTSRREPGTLRDGGSDKRSAFTPTKAHGTPTPETDTTAECSSPSTHGEAWAVLDTRISPHRVSSYSARIVSTSAMDTRGASGELQLRVDWCEE